MFSQIAIGSMAVAGAAAFLLPPNVALEQASSTSTTPFGNLLRDPFSMKISAPCPGCPYAEIKDGGIVWSQGIDSSLFFNIASGKEPDTLELNGARIYPPVSPLDLATGVPAPKIPQIPSSISINNIESDPERYLSHPLSMTSWGLEATTIHSVAHTGEEIVKIQISIEALEGQKINMPYDVVVTALKNPQVPLMVLNVELQRPQVDDCHGLPLLCKFKSMIANMSHRVKGKMSPGCHKGLPHYVSAAEQHKAEEFKKPQHNPHHGSHHDGAKRPDSEHPHRHHRHHHHHHGVHRVLHTIARVILTVVIPLLLGILAGILTYTVGMLVGTAIAMLWIRFRGRSARYQPIALGDEEESSQIYEKVDCEDEAYVEAPPVYIEADSNEVERKE